MGESNEPMSPPPTPLDAATQTGAAAMRGGWTAAAVALRALGYTWASPNTFLGFLFAPLAILSGGRVRHERGAIEVHDGVARWFLQKMCGGACAMTLGHVILGQDRAALNMARNHEHVHVEQYMRWGPFFLPAYALSSYLCWRQGKNPYLENRFEIEAYGKFPVG